MKRQTGIAVPFLLILLGYSSLFSKLPVEIAAVAATLIVVPLLGLYLFKGFFSVGYAGASIALITFDIFALKSGAEAVFPFTGTFFYAGYAVAYLVEGLLFTYKSYLFTAKVLNSLISIIYMVASVLSYFLFPNAAAYYLPAILAVAGSFLIGLYIEKRCKLQETKKDLKRYQFKLKVIPSFLIIMLSVLIVIAYNISNKETAVSPELSDENLQKIDSLKKCLNTGDSAKILCNIGEVFFLAGLEYQSEEWFKRSTAADPTNPEPLAYMAAIMGIKARDAKEAMTKLKLVNQSVQIIDSVIDRNERNCTLRLIRASYYLELPSLFKKSEVASADLYYLLQNENCDEHFQKRAMELMKKNKISVANKKINGN